MVKDEDRKCGVGKAIVLTWVLLAGAACAPSPPAAVVWQDDWSVQRGFAIEIDTAGYTLPSALAFVPEPGPDPKDPLYFVTELHGAVKVVTNDRSVHTFARDFFTLNPVPNAAGDDSLELGLAGICLDQARGYVFVTFVYHDAHGVLRNNIAARSAALIAGARGARRAGGRARAGALAVVSSRAPGGGERNRYGQAAPLDDLPPDRTQIRRPERSNARVGPVEA